MVVEVFHEPFGPRVGDIVRARVTDVDGPRAWVDLGGLTGMLMSAKGRRPDVGETLLCQVQGEPGGDKTVAVTAAIEIPGRYVVLTPLVPGAAVSRKISPPARRKALRAEAEAALSVGNNPGADSGADLGTDPGVGAVVLTAASDAQEGAVRQELGALLAIWRTIPTDGPIGVAYGAPLLADALMARWPDARVRQDRGHVLFEEAGVEEAIEAAITPDVSLPNGASLRIEETAALVAIDVNAPGGEADSLAANLAAADVMGREIRLRGLSGVIMLDAIRMENTTARDAVLDRIQASVDGLEPPVKVLGWTRGGLIEMTRTRRAPSLRERVGLGREIGRRSAAWGRRAVRALVRDALMRALSRSLHCAAARRCGLDHGGGRCLGAFADRARGGAAHRDCSRLAALPL